MSKTSGFCPGASGSTPPPNRTPLGMLRRWQMDPERGTSRGLNHLGWAPPELFDVLGSTKYDTPDGGRIHNPRLLLEVHSSRVEIMSTSYASPSFADENKWPIQLLLLSINARRAQWEE